MATWVNVSNYNLGIYSIGSFQGVIYAGGANNGSGDWTCPTLEHLSNGSWATDATMVNGQFVVSLAEYQGTLYGAGGNSYGSITSSHLLRFNQSTLNWTEVGTRYDVSFGSVDFLTNYNNKLYGALVRVVNGGALQEWDGVTWATKTAQAPTGPSFLATDENTLYGVDNTGGLIEWDNGSNWILRAPGLVGDYVQKLVCANGKVYGGTNAQGRLVRWDSTAWTIIAPTLYTAILDLKFFNGIIYAVDFAGNLLAYDNVSAWKKIAGGSIKELYIYNNSVMFGTDYHYLYQLDTSLDTWVGMDL